MSTGANFNNSESLDSIIDGVAINHEIMYYLSVQKDSNYDRSKWIFYKESAVLNTYVSQSSKYIEVLSYEVK